MLVEMLNFFISFWLRFYFRVIEWGVVVNRKIQETMIVLIWASRNNFVCVSASRFPGNRLSSKNRHTVHSLKKLCVGSTCIYHVVAVVL